LIAQMIRNKMVHITNGLYYADITEYRPIKSNKAMAKLEQPQAPKRKYEKKSTTGIGALLKGKLEAAPDRLEIPNNTPTQRTTIIVRTQAPDEIIKNLTVFQARDLYDRLKQIFGG